VLEAKKQLAKERGEQDKENEEKPEEDVEEEKPEEPEKEEVESEQEEEPTEEPRVDIRKLDVFGLENILDVGGGEPLFSHWGNDDWTMLNLRLDMHQLMHHFEKDAKDPERNKMTVEHLPFYYQRYHKKMLNTKYYGANTVLELLNLIKDTVQVCGKHQILEPKIAGDLDDFNVFAMLVEEERKDRLRRIGTGDETAKLNIQSSVTAAGGTAAHGSIAAATQGQTAAPKAVSAGGLAGILAARNAALQQKKTPIPTAYAAPGFRPSPAAPPAGYPRVGVAPPRPSPYSQPITAGVRPYGVWGPY